MFKICLECSLCCVQSYVISWDHWNHKQQMVYHPSWNNFGLHFVSQYYSSCLSNNVIIAIPPIWEPHAMKNRLNDSVEEKMTRGCDSLSYCKKWCDGWFDIANSGVFSTCNRKLARSFWKNKWFDLFSQKIPLSLQRLYDWKFLSEVTCSKHPKFCFSFLKLINNSSR